MTRSAEWDSVRGRRFDEKGPARTLNRWAWFHVQAMKDDKPRLSACTGRLAFPTSFQGAILLILRSRWPLATGWHEQVVWTARAPACLWPSPKRGMGGASA